MRITCGKYSFDIADIDSLLTGIYPIEDILDLEKLEEKLNGPYKEDECFLRSTQGTIPKDFFEDKKIIDVLSAIIDGYSFREKVGDALAKIKRVSLDDFSQSSRSWFSKRPHHSFEIKNFNKDGDIVVDWLYGEKKIRRLSCSIDIIPIIIMLAKKKG